MAKVDENCSTSTLGPRYPAPQGQRNSHRPYALGCVPRPLPPLPTLPSALHGHLWCPSCCAVSSLPPPALSCTHRLAPSNMTHSRTGNSTSVIHGRSEICTGDVRQPC